MPTSLWIAIDNTKALGNTFLFINVFQRFRNLAFLFVLFLIAFTISKQDSTCNAWRQELIVRVLSVKPKAWNDTEGKPVRRGWKKINKAEEATYDYQKEFLCFSLKRLCDTWIVRSRTKILWLHVFCREAQYVCSFSVERYTMEILDAISK